MVSRTAGNDKDFADAGKVLRRPAKLGKVNFRAVFGKTAAHGIFNCFRLFIYFFQHKVLKTAFFGSFGIPVNFKNFFGNRRTVNVLHPNAVLGNGGNFAVAHNISAAGFGNNRRNIGGNKVFAFTKADNQRIIFFRANELIRLCCAHKYQ